MLVEVWDVSFRENRLPLLRFWGAVLLFEDEALVLVERTEGHRAKALRREWVSGLESLSRLDLLDGLGLYGISISLQLVHQ